MTLRATADSQQKKASSKLATVVPKGGKDPQWIFERECATADSQQKKKRAFSSLLWFRRAAKILNGSLSENVREQTPSKKKSEL